MLAYVEGFSRISETGLVRVDGSHQRGFIAIHGTLPTKSPVSMELDIDGSVEPGDVKLDADDLWGAARPGPGELVLKGILRQFEDGGGLLKSPDGIILLDFCEDFPAALIDIPVQVAFTGVHGVVENT